MLGPRSRRELDALGRARCGARKMPQGPEPLCCEERPGELGLLSLEQRRLRGIPAVAGSTCREAPRGRSRALPGGAQGRARRPRARPGAREAPPAPQQHVRAGRVPEPWPRLPREGLGAAPCTAPAAPARGAGRRLRGLLEHAWDQRDPGGLQPQAGWDSVTITWVRLLPGACPHPRPP